MQQTIAILTFDTDGQGLHEITEDITSWLRESQIRVGILTLFCQHTSAGLLITENASPAVPRDLLRWLARTAPTALHCCTPRRGSNRTCPTTGSCRRSSSRSAAP